MGQCGKDWEGRMGRRQQQGCKINKWIKKQRGKVYARQWHSYMSLKWTTLFIQWIFTECLCKCFCISWKTGNK